MQKNPLVRRIKKRRSLQPSPDDTQVFVLLLLNIRYDTAESPTKPQGSSRCHIFKVLNTFILLQIIKSNHISHFAINIAISFYMAFFVYCILTIFKHC